MYLLTMEEFFSLFFFGKSEINEQPFNSVLSKSSTSAIKNTYTTLIILYCVVCHRSIGESESRGKLT